MSIDWSKAPADATHHHEEARAVCEHWRKDGFFCNVGFESEGWQPENYPLPLSRYSTRPVAEWGGVGLPPVGMDCEMRLWPDGKWETCRPVYYLEQPIDHSDQVVVYQNNLRGDVCYIIDPPCSGSIEFRPIRTAEQIAAEDREEAIRKMLDEEIGLHRRVAELVYDAGYRKQVQP